MNAEDIKRMLGEFEASDGGPMYGAPEAIRFLLARVSALQSAVEAARPLIELLAWPGNCADAKAALPLFDAATKPAEPARHATDEDIARHVMGLDGSQDAATKPEGED